MMAKLKRVLVGAAALIVAGASVGYALLQSGQTEEMTCPQWCAAIDRVTDVQAQRSFFVAVEQGAVIPKAVIDVETQSSRVLGDCSDGTCTIAPGSPCGHCAYTYEYDLGPLVVGWRIAEVSAHPYVAKGWKLAAADQADLRWYGSLADVVTDCLAHFTGPQCLSLLDKDARCWLLDDGNFCRYGMEYGPGLGGDTACRYARVQAVLPCTVNRGAGSEMTDATRVWEDEEMDEL